MKKVTHISLGLAAAGSAVIGSYVFLAAPTTPSTSGEITTLMSAIRTVPDFAQDTRNAAAIIRGKILSVEPLATPVMHHGTQITIEITEHIKGLDGAKTVTVLAYGNDASTLVENSEIPNVKVGDEGVFYLDWMPTGKFYEFFGGARGALVRTDGNIRDWNNARVNEQVFVDRIKKALGVTTPQSATPTKTLGDELREIGAPVE